MSWKQRSVWFAVACALLAVPVRAHDIPRSARLMKDAGNQFLEAKRYSDAIDCYFQALDVSPDYPEAHYNLGVAFLKGYKAVNLALYHFERYLQAERDAADAESVEALVAALRERVTAVPPEEGRVLAVVAGRLLVSGAGWVKAGDKIEVRPGNGDPCACLLAEYVYPTVTLTERIWDEGTLEQVKPGFVALNLSREF